MGERPSIEPFLPLIRRKCQEVHREYRGYLDLDDLVQEVAVWWLTTNQRWIRDLVRGDEDGRHMRLRRAVWRVADAAARKAKRFYGPDTAFVQARYSGRQVLELLHVAMAGELPDGGGIKDGPRKPAGNAAEGGDILAELIDVRRAYDALPDEDRHYLLSVQETRWNYDAVGLALGVEPDSVRRRVARIAQRAANWLNNEEDTDDEDARPAGGPAVGLALVPAR